MNMSPSRLSDDQTIGGKADKTGTSNVRFIEKLPPGVLTKILLEFRWEYGAIDDNLNCYGEQPYLAFLRPFLYVSKAFQSAALEHLYYKLDVSNFRIVSLSHNAAEQLNILLKYSRDPHINKHVRKVSLCWHSFGPPCYSLPGIYDNTEERRQQISLVQEVLENLPGLRGLAIGCCRFCPHWLPTWCAILENCKMQRLTELSIDAAFTSSFDPLCGSGTSITRVRKQLKALHLYLTPCCLKERIIQIGCLDDMTTLEHLHLDGSSSVGRLYDPLLSLDLSNFRSSALSSFGVAQCRMDGNMLAGFISCHIRTLKSLVIDECELTSGTWQAIFEVLLGSNQVRSFYFRSLRYAPGASCIQPKSSTRSSSVTYRPNTPRFEDTHTLADLIKRYRVIRGHYLSHVVVTRPTHAEARYQAGSWKWRISSDTYQAHPPETDLQSDGLRVPRYNRLRKKTYIVEDPFAFEGVATMKEINSGVPLGTGIVPRTEMEYLVQALKAEQGGLPAIPDALDEIFDLVSPPDIITDLGDDGYSVQTD